MTQTELAETFCLALCHDLRSPVATAAAAVKELGRLDPPVGSERFLEIARESLSRADELLGALPELLEPGSATLQPVELETVVAAARRDVRVELELARGSIRVTKPLPRVVAHPARLRIALRNLVHNAIRHRRTDVPPTIAIRAWRRSGSCTLTVADNGRGLREPGAEGGLGIGVALARRAIEGSGGRLALSPRARCGTVAAVTLPLAGGPPAAPR